MTGKTRLGEVASVFFKLGCIAFGGPAAHIAMMEEEVVRRRRWMDHEHFLDLVGATNLIPGPNSTEMTMHCGYERAGLPGLMVAGACFILPAVVITGVIAWLYVTYGQLPAVQPFLWGIKPVVLVILFTAIMKLGQKAVKSWELGLLGLLVVIASLSGLHEIIALLLAGLAGGFYFWIRSSGVRGSYFILPLLLVNRVEEMAELSTAKIFWIFLKIGAILYGSGYVLFAYLDAELVGRGWLSYPQLMDAVAVGQMTPGPVLSTATFIGYQLAGTPGAMAATAGIFLPSFLLVFLLNPLVPKMRQSRTFGFFLDSVNVAAVAVMVAVLFEMAGEILPDWQALMIIGISCLFTYGPLKINTLWLVMLGAALGYMLQLTG